jgi:hypothetical protein
VRASVSDFWFPASGFRLLASGFWLPAKSLIADPGRQNKKKEKLLAFFCSTGINHDKFQQDTSLATTHPS